MLKHEDNPDTLSQTAAQVRVTPEELATAVSRIEARKDTDQRRAEGTIPIEEAVQQLGLQVTPEEVLAEVRAGRQRQTMTRKRLPPIAERLVLSLGLGGILLGLGLGGSALSQMRSHEVVASVSTSSATSRHILLDPNLLVGDRTGKLVMLSEVGDDQPVHCRYSDGRFQQFSPENNVELWQLVKHGGKVYVRGRILKMSPKVFLSQGADVTAVDNDPRFSVPVTLPLEGFDVLPGVGSNVEFHAVNIHLDKHVYEKWNQ